MAFNPIGTITSVPGFDLLVDKMKEMWTQFKTNVKKIDLSAVTEFLTQCLDDMIVFLVEHEIPGADKKATVLAAISKLYDFVITGVLPFWLRPFSGWVKDYIINVQVSHMIDWIVAKYNNGSWHPEATTNVLKKYSMSKELFGVPGDHRPH